MSLVNVDHTIKRLREAGAACVCLACFFTPLSTSLLGAFSILAVAAWIFSGGFLDLPRVFRANPSSLIALLLFCFMGAAISYSSVTPMDGLETLRKYRELLLMPVMFSLLGLSSRWRSRAQTCFLCGCIILLAVSYLMFFDLIDGKRYGHSLVYHITHSFFMAVVGYWALYKSTAAGWRRYIWLAIFAAAVVNLFYIAPGRTGMFVFCCLILLFLYQRLSLMKLAAAVVVFIALLAAAYQTSDNFSGRVNEAFNEMSQYEPGKSRTSIGQRFDWWTISLQLIKAKPLFGYGTGSYEQEHHRAIRNSKITPTDNPHNEYLFLGVQFGLIGLALFTLVIILQVQEAKRISKKDRQLLHGVLVALLAGSLMNSLLFDSQQGHFYLFMSTALLAAND